MHPTFILSVIVQFTILLLIEMLYSQASIFLQELLGYKDIEMYKGLFRVAELQVSR